VYEDIRMCALKEIADYIGSRNVLLALVHAALPRVYIRMAKSTGMYLWWAVPVTTAYIPLDQIKEATSKPRIIQVRRAYNAPSMLPFIPTCLKQAPVNKNEPWCASCGGVYMGPNNPKMYFLEVTINGTRYTVAAYTTATLIHMLLTCKIGYQITKEGEGVLSQIYPLMKKLSSPMLFIRTELRMYLVLPLVRE